MQKNYDMVEVLKLNGDDMKKALHVNRNLCMDMYKFGHNNKTGIFINCAKAFIDCKKQNSNIWCYCATDPGTKVNKPKGDMDSWFSEISNDEEIGNIRTKSNFPSGIDNLISQLEVERMSDQAEKRALKGEDNDFPSDARTVLGPELPEGASI